jgi:hypothetical protein
MLLFFFQAALLASLFPSSAAHAQTLPADFKFSATVGASTPWGEKATITLDKTGQGHYARYITGDTPTILVDTTFTVGMTGLAQLWKTIQDSSFSTLTSVSDSTVQDGEFARVTVTANGTSHQVVMRNTPIPRLNGIIAALNAIIPPSLHLSYAPPGSLNIVPIDPCASPSGSIRILLKGNDFRIRSSTDSKLRTWFDTRSVSVAGTTSFSHTRSIAGITANVDVPHAGTVVAYNISIQDAIKKKVAKLSSKGEFFGDGVSITVDNTKIPPRTLFPSRSTLNSMAR